MIIFLLKRKSIWRPIKYEPIINVFIVVSFMSSMLVKQLMYDEYNCIEAATLLGSLSIPSGVGH